MSESPNNRGRLRKATPTAGVAVIVATVDMPPMPSRETLLQWRQGLILQLRAIERILWPTGRKDVEMQEEKR